MKTTFIILGYGVPKDIAKDTNMQLYLRACFNAVYDELASGRSAKTLAVLTGGRTDLFKPYRRTEAGEMATIVRLLMQREIVQKVLRGTKLTVEKSAISLVENLLASKKSMKHHGQRSGRVVVFCEKTRETRIKRVARIVLGSTYKLKIIGIDFDVSANRYRDPKFLAKKNSDALRFDLWALKSSANFKRYHQVHLDRLRFLRKAGNTSKEHIAAINRWWEQQLATLPKQ